MRAWSDDDDDEDDDDNEEIEVKQIGGIVGGVGMAVGNAVGPGADINAAVPNSMVNIALLQTTLANIG